MFWIVIFLIGVITGIEFWLLFTKSRKKEEELRLEIAQTKNKLKETEILLHNAQSDIAKLRIVPTEKITPKPDEDMQLASMRESFSMAAHDLRSPVAIIRSAASLLQNSWDKLTPEKIKEFIKNINDEAEHMNEMLSRYLDLSKIQAGKLVLEKQLFDLQSVLIDVCNHYRQVAYDKKIYFEFIQTETDLPKVNADITKTREILNNLISNAIKYTYQGGITIKCFQEEHFISITITDTGLGISSQNQRLLFQKFQQVGSSRGQTSAKSSGLGLYLTKKTALAMGGDLFLESSEPGKGSSFKFKLPLQSGKIKN